MTPDAIVAVDGGARVTAYSHDAVLRWKILISIFRENGGHERVEIRRKGKVGENRRARSQRNHKMRVRTKRIRCQPKVSESRTLFGMKTLSALVVDAAAVATV